MASPSKKTTEKPQKASSKTAKTVKAKTDDKKKATKAAKTSDGMKIYSMDQKFSVGEMIKHETILSTIEGNEGSTSDIGEVIETGKTNDGQDKMIVKFKTAGRKRLIFNLH